MSFTRKTLKILALIYFVLASRVKKEGMDRLS